MLASSSRGWRRVVIDVPLDARSRSELASELEERLEAWQSNVEVELVVRDDLTECVRVSLKVSPAEYEPMRRELLQHVRSALPRGATVQAPPVSPRTLEYRRLGSARSSP